MAIALRQQGAQVVNTDGTDQLDPDFSSPILAGSLVTVPVSYWSTSSPTTVTVDGVPATLAATLGTNDSTALRLFYLIVPADGPGLVHVARSGSNIFVGARAQEWTGVRDTDPLVYVNEATSSGSGINYTTQDQGNNLVISMCADQSSDGPGHWVPPTGYALGLDFADNGAAFSAASAHKVVTSATGATVSWAGTAFDGEPWPLVAVFAPTPDPPPAPGDPGDSKWSFDCSAFL